MALDAGRSIHAQALNDEIVRLLSDNCAELAGARGAQLDPNQIGPHLFAICTSPQTFTGSSSGGGAASVQSSTTSIQNSVLQRRLERARRHKAAKPAGTAPWISRGSVADASTVLFDASDESTSGGGAGGGLGDQRFDLFTSGAFESLDRNVSRFEDGYDSSVRGGTLGADYRFSNSFTAGALATYSKQEGDFDGGGDFDVKTFIPTLYASILPSEKTFVQVVVGRSDQDFDVHRDVRFAIVDATAVTRELSGTTVSKTNGTVLSAGAQFGWDHAVKSFTFGPRVGANYSQTTVDGFLEDGTSGLELRVGKQTVESFQGVAGFYGSFALSAGSGVVLPQFNVEYVHEFRDDADVLDAKFVEDLRGPGAATIHYQTNVPDSDFFNVELGVAAVLPHGIQPYLNVRTMLGNTNFDSVAGTFGVRFEL